MSRIARVLRSAVREVEDGVVLEVEVKPGSQVLKVPSGINPWTRRIEIKLTAEPRGGEANKQLIEELADLFGVSSKNIVILAGEHVPQKTIKVKGISAEEARKAILERLGGEEEFSL